MNQSSILLSLVVLLAPWSARALDLTGEIAGPSGDPLAGATVMILAAGPRSGSSPLCPYTYPDCGKQSVTDGGGRFRLPSLDPAMDFCIIALAPGFEPGINSALLPEKSPVKMKLRSRDLSQLPPERVISGRIIGTAGEPVAGAVISVDGVTRGASTRWGGNGKIDSMTISDLQGEFHVVSQEDFSGAHALVTAAGRSPRWFQLQPGKVSLLRLKAGSTVTGRLLFENKPLAGIALSMVTSERECGKFINDLNAKTDTEGRFTFLNVPAGEKLQLFALMNALQKNGAAFQQEITTAAEAQPTPLGDVAATRSYRLSGQVVLSDGKPLPAKTRLLLSREAAWDQQLIELGEDGSFAATGIPAERITLSVRIPGYTTSPKNPNVSIWDHSTLCGVINGDVEKLKIVLEPASAIPQNSSDFDRPTYEAIEESKKKPFQSAP